MKEKPADPGGMKFPNQDKTVFETFGNGTQLPPKVERVLPSPEEPMPKKLDTSETRTWINEKLKKQEEAEAASDKAESSALPIKEVPAAKSKVAIEEKKKTTSAITSYTLDKSDSAAKVEQPDAPAPPDQRLAEIIKPDAVAAAPEKKTEEKKPETPAVKVDERVRVQLGAYRSEVEARDAFARMQKKFSGLQGRKPLVVKADLGSKGIYYRLRVGGFTGENDAQTLCKALFAKQQACIVAK